MAQKYEPSDTLIGQFCSITGSSPDVARDLLEVCQGNLEMAIGMQMDSGQVPQGPSPPEGACALPSGSGEEVREPIPQKNEVMVEQTYQFGMRGRRRKATSVFDGFRDFQAEARQQQLAQSQTDGNTSTAGSSKRRTLEDLFRPPIDLMFKGSFHAARDIGSKRSKWLMVNIQNVQEFACQVLNRDIWSNEGIKSIVKENFIFWQVYLDSEEGQKYDQFYKVTQWPYIAILDPLTGENLVQWNNVDAVSFCDLVGEFLSGRPPLDGTGAEPACKQARTTSIVDASEDSQLEAAIQASITQTFEPADKPTSKILLSDSSDDEEVDLETFTDSDTESPTSSPIKSWKARSSPCVKKSSGNNKISANGTTSTTINSIAIPESSRTVLEALGNANSNDSHAAETVSDSKEKSKTDTETKEKSKTDMDKNEKSKTDLAKQTENKVNASGTVNPGDCFEDGSNSSISSSSCGHENDGQAKWKQYLGNENDPKTDIMIRFPDGKRQPLSLPNSSKLRALVRYCVEEGYRGDKYEVVTNYPRRQLSHMDLDLTLKELGLFPRETVFVQEIQER